MQFTMPSPLQHKHAALYDELRRAAQAEGAVGEAAKTLAQPIRRGTGRSSCQDDVGSASRPRMST